MGSDDYNDGCWLATDYCRRINCLSFIYFVFHLVCWMFASLVTNWSVFCGFLSILDRGQVFVHIRGRWLESVLWNGSPYASGQICLQGKHKEALLDGVCNCSLRLRKIRTSNTLLWGQCCGKIIARNLCRTNLNAKLVNWTSLCLAFANHNEFIW